METLTRDDSAMTLAAIEWGVSSRPKRGEQHTGDLQIVAPYDGGTLIAVVDGLGHGAEAADCAEAARRSLLADPGEPLMPLVKRCHADVRSVRGARGVVMGIAQLDDGHRTMTWLGIGNVEGVVVQPPSTRLRLLNRGGVVGSSLPPLRAEVFDVSNGGLLIFATDGVDAAFADDMPYDVRAPQEIATDLLTRHGREHDDALVLAARIPASRPT